MRDINIYTSFESWVDEAPDTVLKGNVFNKGNGYIEIVDENGLTQILNINKLFAVVY